MNTNKTKSFQARKSVIWKMMIMRPIEMSLKDIEKPRRGTRKRQSVGDTKTFVKICKSSDFLVHFLLQKLIFFGIWFCNLSLSSRGLLHGSHCLFCSRKSLLSIGIIFGGIQNLQDVASQILVLAWTLL